MTIEQLPDGRLHLELRQSNLSTYQMCPESLHAELTDPQPSTWTDATVIGTAFHAAVEYALLEQREAEMASRETMYSVAANQVEEIGDWTFTRTARGNVQPTIEHLIDTWHETSYGTYEPELIEQPFKHLLWRDDQYDIWLKGTRDCVTTDGLVIDHKTTSSLRSWATWEKQRWAVQPTAYTWATWREESPRTPEMPERPFAYHIVATDGTAHQVSVWRDQSHIDWLTQQAIQIATMVRTELDKWPLNDSGWWCSDKWCNQWANCKGKHMRSDWTRTLKGNE